MEKHKVAKKITRQEKKQLEFLVQDFLELSLEELEQKIKLDNNVNYYWDKLVLFLKYDEFWMDEVSEEDLENSNRIELILGYHYLLKPLWDQIKESLLDYGNNVVPERIGHREFLSSVKNTKNEEMGKYIDLLSVSDSRESEKFHDINLQYKISFDRKCIDIYKRNLDVIALFLNFINEIDISIFAQCRYEKCKKIIVITRSNKQYCPGCAAKKYQNDKWKKNPEEMKEKEKERYHKVRKKAK